MSEIASLYKKLKGELSLIEKSLSVEFSRFRKLEVQIASKLKVTRSMLYHMQTDNDLLSEALNTIEQLHKLLDKCKDLNLDDLESEVFDRDISLSDLLDDKLDEYEQNTI